MAGYNLSDNIRTQLEVQNLKVMEERERWCAHIGHIGDNKIMKIVTKYKAHRK
jgi:hypothetical protein